MKQKEQNSLNGAPKNNHFNYETTNNITTHNYSFVKVVLGTVKMLASISISNLYSLFILFYFISFYLFISSLKDTKIQ